MSTPPHPVDQKEAFTIAVKAVSALKSQVELVVLKDKTLERDFGWVFFYVSRRYAETKDPNYMVFGNGPLVVLRNDGSTHFLPSSLPPTRAISIFEERWRKSNVR